MATTDNSRPGQDKTVIVVSHPHVELPYSDELAAEQSLTTGSLHTKRVMTREQIIEKYGDMLSPEQMVALKTLDYEPTAEDCWDGDDSASE